jgi:hypothetical protein
METVSLNIPDCFHDILPDAPICYFKHHELMFFLAVAGGDTKYCANAGVITETGGEKYAYFLGDIPKVGPQLYLCIQHEKSYEFVDEGGLAEELTSENSEKVREVYKRNKAAILERYDGTQMPQWFLDL